MANEQRIAQLFDLLTKWRRLPAYQLERRVDIFFALYLGDILGAFDVSFQLEYIIPEFPVLKSALLTDSPSAKGGTNHSIKVDFLCLDKAVTKCYLVELKTDEESTGDDQVQCMVQMDQMPLHAFIKGASQLRDASNSKKYEALMEALQDAGLVERIETADKVSWSPSANNDATLKVNVVYIKPHKGRVQGLHVISFSEVLKALEPRLATDVIARGFYNALKTWIPNAQLPKGYRKPGTAEVALNDGIARVKRIRRSFQPWAGKVNIDTFGGKDLLLVDDRPQFAEVAILRAFAADGWEGRWLETYGKPAMKPGLWREWKPGGPGAQEHVPIPEPWVNEKLNAIAAANGNTFSGCWDVVAWKEDRLVFAESKKRKKDRLRDTQVRWLEAALSCGCAVEDFLLVEWDLAT